MDGEDTEPNVLDCILDGEEKPRRLELALLRTITKNFANAQIIGHGGCGVVYKGVLQNGSVAVKKLFSAHTIDDKMFEREVNSMMIVKHENIVRLLGYCSDTQGEATEIGGMFVMGEVRERLLCFEYIQKGSLQNYIKDELRGLRWHERYKIMKGICEGLHHLHKEKRIRHMDLKPENILLGDHLVPKITDFGLARLDEKSQTTSNHRLLSLGYCAPEYLHHGKMSAKSDIYSLGVIILELVTGSKEDPDITKVLRRWRYRWNKTLEHAPLLWYQQVVKCLDLAQWCKRKNPIYRPNIWDIISELNEIDTWDGQIRYAIVSTFDEIMLCLEDMLGIEPLEMHFHFAHSKEMSCSIEMINDTDAYFAFSIATTSLLPFSTQPDKGIVQPQSKLSATITLEAQEKAQLQNHCNEEFSVQSFRIDGIPTSLDVTKDIFDDYVLGKVVDEVNLTVFFDIPPTPEEPKIDTDSMEYQGADITSGEPHLSADSGSLGPSSQVLEVSSISGRTISAGLVGKAVLMLDTLGSSMKNLNIRGFGSGTTAKGRKISILAFEVANTIVKGCNLMHAISKDSIKHLKEVVFLSEGVQNIVSKDIDEFFKIAGADKREELKVFSAEVIRFGDRCKDPIWHNLKHYFNKMASAKTPRHNFKQNTARRKSEKKADAESVMQKLMTYVQFTAELYHEMHALDRFVQDYQRKMMQKEDGSSVVQRGENLHMLKQKIKSQRKHVKSLKEKSLWFKNLEEVMEKLVDVVQFLCLEINNAFGRSDNDESQEPTKQHNRLGPTGLALHYANIINQIDTLVSQSSSVPPTTRDELYQSLPPPIKSSCRSMRYSFAVWKELTISEIKAEMENTLRWLVPIANNTTKAHHCFGWVGEWANMGSEVNSKPTGQMDLTRFETLYHADKEKTEAYILHLVVWLDYLIKRLVSSP